ncbi:MAG: YlbF family regulator [Bacilli bacterium]|nr:YlbF family regulator [Bacilli bacterium]
MDKAISDVVDAIVNSSEYQDCIELKKRMEDNDEITMRIKKIKMLQKKYLRTNDLEVEKELNTLEEELNEIPIYYEYNKRLEIVNQKIEYVTDEINDYFYQLLSDVE